MTRLVTDPPTDALRVLIDCLAVTPIVATEKAAAMRESYFRAVTTAMFDSGKSFGEVAGGALAFLARDDAQQYLRNIDNDLAEQTKIVSQSFSEFLSNGIVPAPHYAERIAIILRRAKMLELERAFLEGWCQHFGPTGGTYSKLCQRLEKLRLKSSTVAG